MELRHVSLILFVKVLDADGSIARLLGCGEKFVELQVQRDAVLDLDLLDQENLRNVTIAAPVLMTRCQFSEYGK